MKSKIYTLLILSTCLTPFCSCEKISDDIRQQYYIKQVITEGNNTYDTLQFKYNDDKTINSGYFSKTQFVNSNGELSLLLRYVYIGKYIYNQNNTLTISTSCNLYYYSFTESQIFTVDHTYLLNSNKRICGISDDDNFSYIKLHFTSQGYLDSIKADPSWYYAKVSDENIDSIAYMWGDMELAQIYNAHYNYSSTLNTNNIIQINIPGIGCPNEFVYPLISRPNKNLVESMIEYPFSGLKANTEHYNSLFYNYVFDDKNRVQKIIIKDQNNNTIAQEYYEYY